MTWFDGRPEHLWQYPPTEEGQRYVECFGGADGLCNQAERFIAKGDHRFAATLLAHAVAADPDSASTREKLLLASVYEALGFGCENATWRNFYLTAAQHLRSGKKAGMVSGGGTALGERLSIDQWFEILSVQLNGDLAGEKDFKIDFDVTDVKQKWRLIVSNGVLTRRLLDTASSQRDAEQNPPNLGLLLTKTQLLEIIRGNAVVVESKIGDATVLEELLDLILVQQGSVRGPSQL